MEKRVQHVTEKTEPTVKTQEGNPADPSTQTGERWPGQIGSPPTVVPAAPTTSPLHQSKG